MDIGTAVRSVDARRRPLVGTLVGWASRDGKRRVALIQTVGRRVTRVGSWRFMERASHTDTMKQSQG